MKSKKIVALMTSAVLFSQFLYVNPTIINAQVADTSLEVTDTSSETADSSQGATDPSLEATGSSQEATDSSQEATNSSSEATNSSSEIEDKCHTEETIKKEYPNSVKFQGIGCQTGTPHGFTLKLDTENMKLQATDIKCGWDQIHHYFPNTPYITIKLIGKDRKIKETFTYTGNDPTEKVKELNNCSFKYGDYLQFSHAEADWRTTISGTVIDKTPGTDYSQRISKNILEENMFQITHKGLKQVPLYKNKIDFQGIGCQTGTPHGFTLNMDTTTMKLKVTNIRCGWDQIHHYFPNTPYITIKLIGKDGNVKNSFIYTGNDPVDKVKELNNCSFEYGDYLQLYHAEADWRTTISGKVKNATCGTDYTKSVSKDILEHNMFKITRSGLKQVKIYPNVITLAGVGCQEGTHRFEILFNTDTKKLNVRVLNGVGDGKTHPFHPYFGNNEYIKITLLDQDGNIKHEASLTGNENVTKIQNELSTWNFEYGYRIRIKHEEADWRTKISGTVTDPKGNTVNLSEKTSKEDLNKYDFEITESGLKEVPTFTNELNKTKITLAGVGCQEGTHRFEVTLDPLTKKFNVKILNGVGDGQTHPFHPYFEDNEYINIQLIGVDGNKKKEFSLKGTDNVTKLQKSLSTWKFEYGDYLKIKHEEADWRTKIEGNVTNPEGKPVDLSQKTDKNVLDNYMFKITKKGLQEVKIYPNVITLAGVGCQEGTHRFEILFNTDTKKLNVRVLNGIGDGKTHPFHPYFGNNEYINIQLIGKDGNKKNEFSLKGTDNVTKLQNELSTWNFVYGDYLKIKHEEADWRTTISGTVKNATCGTDYTKCVSKDILEHNMFKITKNGLKQVKIYPNVITLAGVGCQEGIHRFEILFNTDTKKLNVRVLNGVGDGKTHPFHPYFGNNEYIKITLLDKYGNTKNEASLTGNENVTKIQNKLSTWNFVYGDCIRIKHEEADWRTKISGTVDGATPDTNYNERISKDILENNMFKITKNGLKQVKIYKNEISLSGAQNEQGKTPSFKLKFDTDAMRIRVTDLVNPCSKLNGEYANTDYICLTLIGKDGVHKKRVVLNGNTRAIKALCFSGVRFEYGDKIKIYHAQAGSTSNKFTISGLVDGLKEGCSDNFSKGVPQNVMHRCAFEITEDGLKEVRDVERSIEEPCLQEVQ